MKIEEKVKSVIQEEIQKSGYILDEVEYKPGNLTVVIDKQGIIDIDDCVTVTRLINPILDKYDFIEESH